MKAGRVVAIVIGGIVGLLGMALLVGGSLLAIAYAVERDDGGFFDETFERIGSATAAVTTEEADLRTDPPAWLLDVVDFTVRVKADAIDPRQSLFIGIGPADEVEAYLVGVARDEIRELEPRRDVRYRLIPGELDPANPPGDETFWVASAEGTGEIEFSWEFTEGTWVAVLMNADASRGILADVTVGIRSGAILPIGLAMLGFGVLLVIIAVLIIVLAVREVSAPEPVPGEEPEEVVPAPEPVRLEARLDEPLSRWLWLVKWFLAIPHFIVLFFLYIAFAVLWIIAFFAILFTARYPRGVFTFNVGVLRWTWRVLYYCASGGLGTDRYPPFTINPDPDYPAHFDVDYPERLSRGLVLVKWWLLAIPHFVIVAILVGGWGSTWDETGGGWPGLTVVLAFFAAVALLVTGRYPRSIFDLVIGLNRWAFRVFAYTSLMTDRYPPFRLDQGGEEPVGEAVSPPPMR